jgi:demethylmenaquinone methyltransferase/2-methoxy-6-polyprenyl-1,4-benzoquinol methylase
MVAYYEARAPEYDDWYLRRGRYAHGAIDDVAWATDLDAATLWLDGLPWRGRIVELAAGTGWWSPLLAARGELSAYDAAGAPLDRARDRLLAHGLRAHLHVRDAWAEPDQSVDGLFTGFWLSHIERPALGTFLALARRWLVPGGLYAFIDSLPDPASGGVDRSLVPGPDRSRRQLADGRTFEIPKVHYAPADLGAALEATGFTEVEVTTTSRFFVLGRGTAAATS